MICPNCSHDLPENARVCKYCGEDFYPNDRIERVYPDNDRMFPDIPEPQTGRIRTSLASDPGRSYGERLVSLMKALSIIAAVLMALGLGGYGGFILYNGSQNPDIQGSSMHGVLFIAAGIAGAILFFFAALIFITRFDNICRIGYNTEKTSMASDNQLHVLSQLVMEVSDQHDLIMEQNKAFAYLGESLSAIHDTLKLIAAKEGNTASEDNKKNTVDRLDKIILGEERLFSGLRAIAECYIKHAETKDQHDRKMGEYIGQIADRIAAPPKAETATSAPVVSAPVPTPQAQPAPVSAPAPILQPAGVTEFQRVEVPAPPAAQEQAKTESFANVSGFSYPDITSAEKAPEPQPQAVNLVYPPKIGPEPVPGPAPEPVPETAPEPPSMPQFSPVPLYNPDPIPQPAPMPVYEPAPNQFASADQLMAGTSNRSYKDIFTMLTSAMDDDE